MVSTAKESKVKASASVADLQDKMKNAKALREKELKEAENATAKAKKALENSQKKMKEKQQVSALFKLSFQSLLPVFENVYSRPIILVATGNVQPGA